MPDDSFPPDPPVVYDTRGRPVRAYSPPPATSTWAFYDEDGRPGPPPAPQEPSGPDEPFVVGDWHAGPRRQSSVTRPGLLARSPLPIRSSAAPSRAAPSSKFIFGFAPNSLATTNLTFQLPRS
ncbi:MAG: hypothetical protein C0467_30100 [Planctomycetaceae bacterium]|nr:hypothetical protein [Planctomycetaceae bacterium]